MHYYNHNISKFLSKYLGITKILSVKSMLPRKGRKVNNFNAKLTIFISFEIECGKGHLKMLGNTFEK